MQPLQQTQTNSIDEEKQPQSLKSVEMGDDYWIQQINDLMDDDITEFKDIKQKLWKDINGDDNINALHIFEMIVNKIRKERNLPIPDENETKLPENPDVNKQIDGVIEEQKQQNQVSEQKQKQVNEKYTAKSICGCVVKVSSIQNKVHHERFWTNITSQVRSDVKGYEYIKDRVTSGELSVNDFKIKTGETLLIIAVKSCAKTIVQSCLQKNANIFHKDKNLKTALEYSGDYKTKDKNSNQNKTIIEIQQLLITQIAEKCDAVQRIKTVFSYGYSQPNVQKNLFKLSVNQKICEQIRDEGIDHNQLFNDFCHIKDMIAKENNKIRNHNHQTRELICIKKANHQHEENCYGCLTCDYVNIGNEIFECFSKTSKIKCCAVQNDNDEKQNTDVELQCIAFEHHYRDKYKDTEQKRAVEDNALLQECAKIHSYIFHSPMRFGINPNQINTEQEDAMDQLYNLRALKLGRIYTESVIETETAVNNVKYPMFTADVKKVKSYIGKKDDDAWWHSIEEKNITGEQIYTKLVTKMGVFRWQNPHGFIPGQKKNEISQLKPFKKNIKEEALHNQYAALSKDNWNETLRKSQIFYNSFARKRISTRYDGKFDDQLTQQRATWKKGEAISMAEIVTLKLYTDFDKLQFELKKCFRFETVQDIVDKPDEKKDAQESEKLIKRLQEFYHWRGALLIVLNKYGKRLHDNNNMILYHGVNTKFIVKPNVTYAFSGPLSTTSSYHVARTFATAKGMILKINSHFPRLNYCNAFDVSLISDYPEEEEWLVGFMYVRILAVRTRKLI
eukprot:89017_1